jgi:uncharacterized protein (TIGR02246 family)
VSTEQAVAREHIRDLVARYNIAGDRRDLEAFVGVFAESAVYESAVFHCEGRPQIRDYLTQAWQAKPQSSMPRFRRHHITTTQIDLAGPDSATGRIYYLVTTDLGLDHCGYYVDAYVRVDGRWLISHREVWMDWSHPDSLYVPEASKALVRDTGASGPPARMRS